MKKYFFGFLALGLILSLAACATSPTGRKQIILESDDSVNEMGVAAFTELKKQTPSSKDGSVNAYVSCVAKAITDALPEKQTWEVIVFVNDEPNAFALPGGKIGVHTGMLKVAETPAQLAAVLGHEVGHVLARHSNERLSEQKIVAGGSMVTSMIFKDKESKTYQYTMAALGAGAQYGFVLPHSRTQESEADIIGLQLMSKAGFDPRQSVVLWQNMQKAGGSTPPEFLSTHPANATRIQALQANMGPNLATYEQTKSRPICKR